MKQISIGPCTGLLKPKYKVISTILGESFNPENGLDVFIDLNTLVTALSSYQKYLNGLPFAENVEEDMIYSVLMTLKHWKDYTRKWNDVRIFMFVNNFEMYSLAEQDTLKSYLIPYVNKFNNERFKQFTYYWNESIKRIEIVLKYIPNSYMIRCNRFDSMILPQIIDDYEHNLRHRIIITGNALMTNYTFSKNVSVIYSRYKHTGMSQLSDPLMIVQSISKIDDDIMSTFIKNKVFYNLLNAIIGDFDRGIIGLTQLGISSFANDLLRSVEKREIPEKPVSIESVLPAVRECYHDYIRQVYPIIDITSHAKMVKPSMIEKVKSNMVDLYDIDGLRSLNVSGLNLLELM